MARTGRSPYETTEIVPFGVESRRLQPPDCLGELQKRAFVDLVVGCPASQFRKGDLSLLCRWAELTVMAEQAVFELQQGGMVVNTEEGSKVSPWFAIYRDVTRELRQLSQRLQIGPRGRTWKAPKTKPPGTVSYYERARLEGEFDDAGPS
jgi:phage terminase small subunit